MTASGRRVLSLPKRRQGESDLDEKRVLVGLFDVLLPSRQFIVHHKVAELGQVSLTTEFLLRLLYSVDGMEENDIAQFFGFNANEMAFVVNEAESRAYILRQEGKIWLTDAGRTLFKDSDRPEIFEVQKRTEKVGFDLISLAPCDREWLSEFERLLPELEICDAETVATASREVPDAFRRYYSEITRNRERSAVSGMRRSLYSVDEVSASDRFASIVPVLAMASITQPGDPEPVLDVWRSGHELGDRSAVVNAIAAFIDQLKTEPRAEDANAYAVLLELAPDYLRDYRIRGGLSVNRFFKETGSRAGELRVDRRTVGIIGPLFSPENSKRVHDALRYSSSHGSESLDEEFLWIVPASVTWGMSRALSTFVESVSKESGSDIPKESSGERIAIAMTCGKPEKLLFEIFGKVLVRADNGAIPSALEVLIIPQRILAVSVHAPICNGRGFPIPLGIISFDQDVVARACSFLKGQLPQDVRVARSPEVYNVHRLIQGRERSTGSERKVEPMR